MPKPAPKVDAVSPITAVKTGPDHVYLRFTGSNFEDGKTAKIVEKRLVGTKTWDCNNAKANSTGTTLVAKFKVTSTTKPPKGEEIGQVDVTVTNADNPAPAAQQTSITTYYVESP
jgi:hypothetical protein